MGFGFVFFFWLCLLWLCVLCLVVFGGGRVGGSFLFSFFLGGFGRSFFFRSSVVFVCFCAWWLVCGCFVIVWVFVVGWVVFFCVWEGFSVLGGLFLVLLGEAVLGLWMYVVVLFCSVCLSWWVFFLIGVVGVMVILSVSLAWCAVC